MSELRWDWDGVQVHTFAGPVDDTRPDRRRVQVNVGARIIQCDMTEWQSLCQYVRLAGDDPFASRWLERKYERGLSRNGMLTCISIGLRGDD